MATSSDPGRLFTGPRRYDLACRVDPYRSGWTLLAFLTARFRYHDEARWRERISDDAVRVNGRDASIDTVLAAGDEVSYSFVHTEPAVDPRFTIAHEDADLLAVAKSGNLPVHAGGRFITHTLTAMLRDRVKGPIHLAHRLDRETSGLVLVARSPEMARALEAIFQAGRVEKRYLALVRGAFPEELEAGGAIGRREPRRPPYFRVVTDGGKPASTRFERVAMAGDVSLVAAMPRTGRTHQIRVHLHHAGYPVIGDKLYGVPAAIAGELAEEGPGPRARVVTGAERHLLHCRALSLPHPRTGTPLALVAPIPDDLEAAWPGPEPLPDHPG